MECLAVQSNWNKSIYGHCINNTLFRWSWAGFNTVTDLWVLILPLPILWRLRMTPLKKFSTVFIFCLGLFIIATSIIWTTALVAAVNTDSDSTWSSSPIFIWSHIEASVGFIATCLPVLRAPIARILPKWITGTSGDQSGKSSSHRIKIFTNQRRSGKFDKTIGFEEVHMAYITTEPRHGEFDDSESQEQILPTQPQGIIMQHDILINSHALDI
ncbi:hypothetical protein M433DRAFT_294979 [Acidomyces richmondensis BFW]|nr:MAG: hypothetical protein FE78DRAFT_447552 [Acidomyces sp. 'richmondensis']KYG44632.1 hypothetical protein M433DRAFT_294979 [Acidomyces richmondensis BFW]